MTDLEVQRAFDAPAAALWAAWTESDAVRAWWGPQGFTCPVARMDVRVGGVSLVAMRTPDGVDLWNTWTYTRIDPGERLEFRFGFSDADGRSVDPQDAGFPPGIPREVPHVVTVRDGLMTVIERGYADDETAQLSRTGLESSLDKLAAALTS
ncbi:SRPBCC family protein [Cellulomonas fengjieae]|uniref:SRPBCC domain-containing protein n=1 Tax=Cellulomonas fengjieae TaxID=2819978 RepID=A0ABS3SJW5_9CELL|nr:SRPBCC domain-containing protein [Cellulomonas fengjieae]MBO3086038.1 SRPBCC domain-containing protein [Cellulomonas fengjieae]MBO3103988.1 SRPBCC domain-containing protein [Cellulomonas fengjieae]QVI65893.1 SRPBCC domain-containing protein [Cellulomonas fengjieae]